MTRLNVAVLSGLLALVGCDEGAGGEESAVETEAIEHVDQEPAERPGGGEQQAGSEPQPGGAFTLQVRTQQPYGEYLAGRDGRTLYMFTADQRGQSSACYERCAEAWPPVLTEGAPQIAERAEGLNRQMLGTIQRRDGAQQVTYNGWPLYYFEPDRRAGQITGQDKEGFGGEWYLMGPDGQRIEAEAGEQAK